MRAIGHHLASAVIRIARHLRLPVASTVIAVAALLTLPSAWAAFTGTTANSSTVGAGTVTLTDNDSSDTLKLFNLTGLLPGDTSTSCIKVTYGGTLPALVDLFGTTTGTGLDAYLDLVVTRGTGLTTFGTGCTGFTADSTNYIGAGAGVIFNSTLQAYPDTSAAGLADPRTAAIPEAWTTNETHSYKFQITVQNNSAAQNLTANQAFTWQADNTTLYSQVILSDGPVNYWKLDEANGAATAVDATGANNTTYNGALVTGVTTGVKDGVTAAVFDRTNDWIEGADFNDLTGNATFSLECWVNPLAANGTFPALFGKSSAAAGGWNLYLESTGSSYPNSVTFSRQDAALAQTWASANFPLTVGSWQHVVATYDGTRTRIYINGTQRANVGMATVLPNTTVNMVLGAKSDHTNKFGGTMDEMAVYTYTLSQQQVTEHYLAGLR